MGTPIDLLDLVRATNRAVDAAVGDFLGAWVALPRLSWALRPHTWWHLVGSVPETEDVSHVLGLLARWATVLGCTRRSRTCRVRRGTWAGGALRSRASLASGRSRCGAWSMCRSGSGTPSSGYPPWAGRSRRITV